MSAATATAAAATAFGALAVVLARGRAKQLKAEPQALIFDCDGTLLDTMPLWWPGWVTTCAKYGLRFSKRRFYAMAGTPVHIIFKTLAEEQHVDIDIDEVMRFKKSQSRGKGCPARIAPVVDIALEAHRRGIPLAVASSGTRDAVRKHLEEAGILHLFGAVVTCEDVQHQKPHPQIYLEAAQRLGVPAARCRAFEDADLGMESIRRAGMDAVDVRLMDGYPQPSFDDDDD